jgi:hypothetical protein
VGRLRPPNGPSVRGGEAWRPGQPVGAVAETSPCATGTESARIDGFQSLARPTAGHALPARGCHLAGSSPGSGGGYRLPRTCPEWPVYPSRASARCTYPEAGHRPDNADCAAAHEPKVRDQALDAIDEPSPASALTPRRPSGSSSRAATRLEEPRRVRQRRRSRWLVACVRAPPGAPLSPRNLRARQDHTHVDQPATEAPVAARDEGPGRGRREIARRRHGLARQERRMPTGHNALTRCTNWAEEPLPLGRRDRDHRRLAGGIRARRRRRTR